MQQNKYAVLLLYVVLRRAICSVEQEQLSGGQRVVLLATPNALYITAGGPGLQPVFAK
jgi:hypothetical protein